MLDWVRRRHHYGNSATIFKSIQTANTIHDIPCSITWSYHNAQQIMTPDSKFPASVCPQNLYLLNTYSIKTWSLKLSCEVLRVASCRTANVAANVPANVAASRLKLSDANAATTS